MNLTDVAFVRQGDLSTLAIRPRFVNDGRYHIEWHYDGLWIEQCPEGSFIKSKDADGDDTIFDIHQQQLLEWSNFQLKNYAVWDNKDAANYTYEMRVRHRDEDEWISPDRCFIGNVNSDVMLNISEVYENIYINRNLRPSEVLDRYGILQVILPQGVDDKLRTEILAYWKKRVLKHLTGNYLLNDRAYASTVKDSLNVFYNMK